MRKELRCLAGSLSLAALLAVPVGAAVEVGCGMKAGLSLSKLKETPDESASKRKTTTSSALTTPIVGVYAAAKLNNLITLQPELYFATFGGRYEYSEEGRNDDCLRYVHLPVLAKARLPQRGRVTPTLFAGPAVDYLLSAKSKRYIDGEYQGQEDFEAVLKSTNFCLVFGGGAEARLTKLNLSLDARYDLGLSNIEEVGAFTRKTQALYLLAGVGF